jgi:iron complex transport system ATP-binding protein
LLLADGRASACGAAPEILAAEPLSACFGVPVSVSRADGRWTARATPSW